MDSKQMAAWIQAGAALVGAGIAAADDIARLIRGFHGPALSDAELAAILVGVQADAERRAAQAAGDAGLG